jgi:hypothetical protein
MQGALFYFKRTKDEKKATTSTECGGGTALAVVIILLILACSGQLHILSTTGGVAGVAATSPLFERS